MVALSVLLSTTMGLSSARAINIEDDATNVEYSQDEVCYGPWEREVLTKETYEELLVNTVGLSRSEAQEKAAEQFRTLNTRAGSTELVRYSRTVFPNSACRERLGR